jgi:hypothetical protein
MEQNETIKLYYLNPNGYGAEMFIATTSKELAWKAFQDNAYDGASLKTWDINNLQHGYTIDEYEVGQVIHSEIA